MILLKKALKLFISIKHNKNKILIDSIWNVIDIISLFKIIDLINITFLILNVKMADLAIFLISWTKILSYHNFFN